MFVKLLELYMYVQTHTYICAYVHEAKLYMHYVF